MRGRKWKKGGGTTVQVFFVNGTIFQYSTGASLVCNQETHQPTTNLYAETYGPGSRCVEHGRQWFLTMSGTNSTSAVYGGGCYQVWLYMHHVNIILYAPASYFFFHYEIDCWFAYSTTLAQASLITVVGTQMS